MNNDDMKNNAIQENNKTLANIKETQLLTSPSLTSNL